MSKKKNKKIVKTKNKEIKGQLGKKKETAREKMIGQSIGYRYDVNLLPDYTKLTPFLKKYIEAMGWDARLPSSSELNRMQVLLEEGLRDGAFGFSTGLTYAPGTYSDTSELIEISKTLRTYDGIYVTHSRYALGDGLLDPFREAVEIGRKAEVPVQISHFHNPVEGMGEQMVKLVDESRSAGVDVTFEQYPYPASSTLLLSLIPPWVHAGGPRKLLDRIASPAVRNLIKDQIYPQWGGALSQYIFSHFHL